MDYIDLLISVIISVFVSAITGWVAAKISYNQEIKKMVYNERNQLYIDLFAILERLQQTPYLMYNTEAFIIPFRRMKAKTNLYASRDVLDMIAPFYNKLMNSWKKYSDLYNSEFAENEIQNRYEFALGTKDITREQIEMEFHQEEEAYIDQHLIDSDEVTEFINNLVIKIRKELKTE